MPGATNASYLTMGTSFLVDTASDSSWLLPNCGHVGSSVCTNKSKIVSWFERVKSFLLVCANFVFDKEPYTA